MMTIISGKVSYYRVLRNLFFLMVIGLISCEKFFDPDQDIVLKEDAFFKDWYDYRAAELGLYGVQQELAEQLMILGELRADLLEVTPDASKDLIEVYNLEITQGNEYASPRNFYKLIAACNSLQQRLEYYHPEVQDEDAPITNYDKLYGEVINMRAWAYFNAVRIYGTVPWIDYSLTTLEEIVEYVNSPKTVIDSFDIIYNTDGVNNDTIWYDEPRELENAYLDLPAIVDSCTKQIETKIKATGVNHFIDNGDLTWEVTVWNRYAMHFLLGQMYFFKGDLVKATANFDVILEIVDIEANDVRYGLDETFSGGRWKNIHSSINRNEHLFVIWFGKSHRQSNTFLSMFSNVPPNNYELKPTRLAIHKWETIWDGWRYKQNVQNPADMTLRPGYPGMPGDFHRGIGVSYAYIENEEPIPNDVVRYMLELKRQENDFEVNKLMEGKDTVVYKYTLGRENDPFGSDANFIIARAASVHLYAAEIHNYYASYNGVVVQKTAEQYLNDGSYNGNGQQMGVRGRVGFANSDEQVIVSNYNIFYKHDPYTNRIVGYRDLTANLIGKQHFLEDAIIEERARELAFEGERFYDLMRVAKRRGDNAYLADRIAAKFSGTQAEMIREKLMDESNWYLPFFLSDE